MENKESKRRQTMISIDKAVLVGLLITLSILVLMMINELIKA